MTVSKQIRGFSHNLLFRNFYSLNVSNETVLKYIRGFNHKLLFRNFYDLNISDVTVSNLGLRDDVILDDLLVSAIFVVFCVMVEAMN